MEGIAPLPSLRSIPRWLGVTGISVATVLLSGLSLWACAPPLKAPTFAGGFEAIQRVDRTVAGNAFLVQGVGGMLIASLVVGVLLFEIGEIRRHDLQASREEPRQRERES